MTSSLALRFAFVLSLVSACAADSDPPAGGGGGKTDDATERCESAELDDNGVCRASDGTFAPASCCEDDAVTCSFDREPVFGFALPGAQTSEKLAEFIVGSRDVGPADVKDLSALESEQILTAMRHLELIEPTDDIDAAVGAADDDLITLMDVEIEVQGDEEDFFFDGDWVFLFAGDNEVGVVFEGDTTTITAEISDGDLMGCE